MPRYIDVEKIDIRVPYGIDHDGEVLVPIAAVSQSIARTPTEDVVSRGVYEQVKWERDMAIQTLEEHGLSLGQRVEKPLCDKCSRAGTQAETMNGDYLIQCKVTGRIHLSGDICDITDMEATNEKTDP